MKKMEEKNNLFYCNVRTEFGLLFLNIGPLKQM